MKNNVDNKFYRELDTFNYINVGKEICHSLTDFNDADILRRRIIKDFNYGKSLILDLRNVNEIDKAFIKIVFGLLVSQYDFSEKELKEKLHFLVDDRTKKYEEKIWRIISIYEKIRVGEEFDDDDVEALK